MASNDPHQDLRGACVFVGEQNSPFGKWAHDVVLGAAQELGICEKAAWWNPTVLAEALEGADLDTRRAVMTRQLTSAPIVAIDITQHQELAHYLLGAREALTSGVTLACARGVSVWEMPALAPVFIDTGTEGRAQMKSRLAERFPAEAARDWLSQPQEQAPTAPWRNSFRASRAIDVQERAQILLRDGSLKDKRRTNQGRPVEVAEYWNLPSDKVSPETQSSDATQPRRVGIRFGDIADIQGAPCWVNSENVEMQMARVIERSISATIRARGARWTGLNRTDSDDAIFLALAREMGVRKRLNIGEVLITRVQENTDLFRSNKVDVVAHVAAVSFGRPGEGFVPGADLGACVANVIESVNRYARKQKLPLKSILMPLLAAGDAGLAPDVAAPQMVGALREWLERDDDEPRASVRTVYLLARDVKTRHAITASLMAYGFQREVGGGA